ncbi:Maf/Ham1 [Saccharata proteae CBS 121410]|uniref:Inosine triphosphate pyrophosphatase n=1 Tax=Saccharata proteae CBS 121410 TaxID=1314787 RepID=A0A9P4HRZ7_9PEZI|nr:Maf/Ham1 [Saccharata proteae CBS 121410]
MAPKYLNFITGNKNKLAEVKAILGDSVELRSQSLDLPEVQGSVEEVTIEKCKRAADIVGGPVLVEDTCLCFKAMNDLPGPYMYACSRVSFHVQYARETWSTTNQTSPSKWFMQSLGPENLHKMLAGFDDKSAQAVCTFGYSEGPGHDPILFQGRTDASRPMNTGKLVPSRGPTTFGWDSTFEYEGRTYAEMEKAEKNKISHRGKALEKLQDWLKSHT